MQTLLNKMVISVRQGYIDPVDASQTIHECAAMMNLDLVQMLPINTLVLSGMRKTATRDDIIRAFRRFGSIEAAAVAFNERGFGTRLDRPARRAFLVSLFLSRAFLITTNTCLSFLTLGFVRYKTTKSVDQAMIRFRTAEIVVQDVAVQVRVLGHNDR